MPYCFYKTVAKHILKANFANDYISYTLRALMSCLNMMEMHLRLLCVEWEMVP